MGYDLCHYNYIGHSVGIEGDEPPIVGPDSKMILENGMLLAIEPKLIIYGKYGLDIEFIGPGKEKGLRTDSAIIPKILNVWDKDDFADTQISTAR